MQRAGRLASWAARTGYSLGKRLPGADSAERTLRSFEQKALAELRRRLESASDPYLATLSDAPALPQTSNGHNDSSSGAVPLPMPAEPLRAGMAALLNRSTHLSRDAARDYLYATILRQLTPDEARILSTLSDGAAYPLVDVAERTSLGGAGRVVLRNASTVGKAAGVSANDHVPAYVSRLIGLGLAEIEDESDELSTQYEVLLTDETVRRAQDLVRRARFIRHTLRISPLGLAFWQACDPARTIV